MLSQEQRHCAYRAWLIQQQDSCWIMQVAPVDGVAFNNLVCARLPIQAPSEAPAPALSSSQEYIAVPATAAGTASTPAPLYVEYAPVVYLHNQQSSSSSDEWQSDINSLTTFLVRYERASWSALRCWL